jgi:hypothetical protein
MAPDIVSSRSTWPPTRGSIQSLTYNAPSGPTATSDGRNSVSAAPFAVELPPTKSEPAYCRDGFEVRKTFRSPRSKPAPLRVG